MWDSVSVTLIVPSAVPKDEAQIGGQYLHSSQQRKKL